MSAGKARDSQRSKTYAAEEKLPGIKRNEFGTVEGTQKWVNDVINSRWFQTRWNLRDGVKVDAGRRGSATSWNGQSRITVGPQARNPWVVLHELAHQIIERDTAGGRAMAGHGPEWVSVYLFLVRQVVGRHEAITLAQHFRDAKVRTRTRTYRVPEPRYHVPTQAAVRERRKIHQTRSLAGYDRRHAAEIIRRAVRRGEFGAAGSKARLAALATARTIEKGPAQ